MHLSLLLEMAASAMEDRIALSDEAGDISYRQLNDGARSVAHRFLADGTPSRVAFLGLNSRAVPYSLFASAMVGAAFVPLSYRLADDELRRIAERAAPALLVADDDVAPRLHDVPGITVLTTSDLLATAVAGAPESLPGTPADPDAIGVLLFTSGTTGEPKAAVLRHGHLMSYVLSTLDFASAGEDEATLVSVPPYHIAGISAIVSSSFVGRRVAYLPSFGAREWVDAVATHRVTHAMVVPTMLGRVLDELDARAARGDGGIPTLRHLSYGGGRMPVSVVERAAAILPHVDLVNAYGLTETSSTIAVLGPDDHRTALASRDPDVRRRLGSVGRPHPGVEVSVRDDEGRPLPPNARGEIWVRGSQVSGEYLGSAGRGTGGWFATNDSGTLDEAGYLYVHGRLDDVIVRGGENISPGEIEEVLRSHPQVVDAAVVGVPSVEWGESILAVVVARYPDRPPATEELRTFVRARLRSNRVPEVVEFRDALPYSETGKLLRRILREAHSVP